MFFLFGDVDLPHTSADEADVVPLVGERNKAHACLRHQVPQSLLDYLPFGGSWKDRTLTEESSESRYSKEACPVTY